MKAPLLSTFLGETHPLARTSAEAQPVGKVMVGATRLLGPLRNRADRLPSICGRDLEAALKREPRP